MKLKDLQTIDEALTDLYDFACSNCDGDESGIYEQMSERFSEASTIIEAERFRNYLKNAKAKIKRERK